MLLPFLTPPQAIVAESVSANTIAWAVSDDGRFAATLAQDGDLSLWSVDAASPRPTAHLLRRFATRPYPDLGSPINVLSVSARGKYVTLRRPTGGFDVWDTDTPKIVRRVDLSVPDYQWSTHWLPSGDAFLVESGRRPTGGRDTSRLVRLNGASRELPISPPWTFTPNRKAVLGIAGTGLALVDLGSGRVLRRFKDSTECFAPFAFSPDGRVLATGGEDPAWHGPQTGPEDAVPTEAAYAHTLKIKLWRVSDGHRLGLFEGYFSPSSVGTLVFPDSRHLAAPELGWTYDVVAGRKTKSFEAIYPEGGFLDLPPLPSDPLRFRTVDFPPRPVLGRLTALSPDGRFLANAESERRSGLLLWDLEKRTLASRIPLPEITNLGSIEYDGAGRLICDGTLAAKVNGPGGLTEYEQRPIRLAVSLDADGRPISRESLQPVPSAPRPFGPLQMMPVRSHAGGFTISSESTDRDFYFADLFRTDATGTRAWTSQAIDVPQSRLVVAPDDRHFAMAWSKGRLTSDSRSAISVFDAATGEAVVTSPLGPTVHALAYASAGDSLLLVTSEGMEIRDASSLKRIASFPERREFGAVSAYPLPRGGFAVLRQGESLRILDGEAKLQTTLVAFPGSDWAAWTPDGRAWGSESGLARLRRREGNRLMPIREGKRR